MEQVLLPGLRRYVPPAPKDYRPWRDARGQQIDVPLQKAPFYGAIVPVPRDQRGELLELGDLSVLLRTDGRYIVVQYADRTDRSARVWSLFLAGRGRAGKKEAVVEMCHIARRMPPRATD